MATLVNPLKIGDRAPAFTLPDQTGKKQSLCDYKGKWVLLYFYPRDDTPGCTKEACGVRDHLSKLKSRSAVVFGISADSVESHKKFARKFKLPFPLLSDEEKKMIGAYGAWGEKKFMGRGYMGIHRISFLINPKGVIARVYEKVKPEEHAEQVLKELAELGA